MVETFSSIVLATKLRFSLSTSSWMGGLMPATHAIWSGLVVGAFGLDVSGLLALVADLLAGRRALGAVAGEVTGLATVVAFAAVNAIACVGASVEHHRRVEDRGTYETCDRYRRTSSTSCSGFRNRRLHRRSRSHPGHHRTTEHP